jgi:hypothetical protein
MQNLNVLFFAAHPTRKLVPTEGEAAAAGQTSQKARSEIQAASVAAEGGQPRVGVRLRVRCVRKRPEVKVPVGRR